MPNYNYVADSSFQPFSFQEMLQPWMLYGNAYEKIENELNDLNVKANIWEGMVNEESDPDTYSRYKKYSDDIKAQAAQLSKQGLNPTTRSALLNLKRRYASEIFPIEQAYQAKEAQAKEQAKALQDDPTRLFSRQASITPLHDYLSNPLLNYEQYSGALLASQAKEAATAISKELSKYISGDSSSRINSLAQYYGLRTADIAEAITDPYSMRGQTVLKTIVDNVIDSSGIRKWADPYTLRRAYEYTYQGLWKAVGDDKVSGFNAPRGKSTGVVAPKQPVMPDLVPESFKPAATPSTPSTIKNQNGKVQSRTAKYGKKKSYGGYLNTYALGGDSENGDYEFKISPAMEQYINAMPDEKLDSFLTSEIGHYPENQWQADSALMAYDKKLQEQMVNNYYKNLFEDTFVSPEYDYRNVLTSNEISQIQQDKRIWDKYKKYFYKTSNGNYALNTEGRNLYDAQKKIIDTKEALLKSGWGPLYVPGGITPDNSGDYDLAEWMNRNGLSEMAQRKAGKEWNEKIESLKNRTNRVYDASSASEYTRQIDTDSLKDIWSRLYTLSQNGKIPTFKRVKEGETYKFKQGEEKNVGDIKSEDVSGALVVAGIHGSYVEISLKDGEKLYLPMEMLNLGNANIINGNINKARTLLQMKANGELVTRHPDGSLGHVENDITQALNDATANMLSALKTSSSKKIEVEPKIHH